MEKNANALNWFEIPVGNIERATKFYETIFDITMPKMEMMNMKMAMFPPDGKTGNVGGCLAESPFHLPSELGSIIYLNANPDLDIVLNKIDAAGGKIVMPKTLIQEEIGYMAFFTDNEGNKVALHSSK